MRPSYKSKLEASSGPPCSCPSCCACRSCHELIDHIMEHNPGALPEITEFLKALTEPPQTAGATSSLPGWTDHVDVIRFLLGTNKMLHEYDNKLHECDERLAQAEEDRARLINENNSLKLELRRKEDDEEEHLGLALDAYRDACRQEAGDGETREVKKAKTRKRKR